MHEPPDSWEEVFGSAAPDNKSPLEPPTEPPTAEPPADEFGPPTEPPTEEPAADAPPTEEETDDHGFSPPEEEHEEESYHELDPIIRSKALNQILHRKLDPSYLRLLFAPSDKRLPSPTDELSRIVERFLQTYPTDFPGPDTVDKLIGDSNLKPAQFQAVKAEWEMVWNMDVPEPQYVEKELKRWAKQRAATQVSYLLAMHAGQKTPVEKVVRQSIQILESALRIGEPMEKIAESKEHEIPPFPESAFIGLAGEFAKTIGEYVSYPPQFLLFDYLAILGAILSPHLALTGFDMPEFSRLYTVKVGPFGVGKSRSTRFVLKHMFKPILTETFYAAGEEEGGPVPGTDRLLIVKGVGSAEGLAKQMMKNPGLGTLVVLDEMRTFVDKNMIQGSIVLPMFNTLFHETEYENVTKDKSIYVKNAQLSVMASCTPETYLSMFSPRYFDMGWMGRTFLVYGEAPSREISEHIPEDIIKKLRQRTLRHINEVLQGCDPIDRDFKIPFGKGPRVMGGWDNWVKEVQGEQISTRLDVYGLRLLLLYAVTCGQTEVTSNLVEAVLPLLNYQKLLRKELQPVDAEGSVAQMETRLRKYFWKSIDAKGVARLVTDRDLRKYSNVHRRGEWLYRTALSNLTMAGVVEEHAGVRGGTNYRLTEKGLGEVE